ncbi:MAG: hypothetical protein JRJ70_15665 [Deltaproteobacteria bacterium]|nr:hypothetical protein [Deltaproteobacteria bacterium]
MGDQVDLNETLNREKGFYKKYFDKGKHLNLAELNKQLAEANKLRHKFWNQLRLARNQIARYIHAHNIQPEEFDKLIKGLSKEKREYFKNEWEDGRKISLEELKEMFHLINILWSTSQFEEELRRGTAKTYKQDDFFHGPTCQNCGLPLKGKQVKFCSSDCRDQYRKKKWKSENKPTFITEATLKKIKESQLKSLIQNQGGVKNKAIVVLISLIV